MAEDRLDPVDIAQLRLNQPAPNASGLIGSAGDDDLSNGADASDTPDISTSDIPPEVNDSLSSMAAKYGDDSPIRKGYEAAIARLKSQRAGMSNKEKIAALLIGFGKPTPGGIGNQLSNAAQMLLAQSAVSNKRDDAREALIAKYMADEPVKMSSAQTAADRVKSEAQRAAEAATAKARGTMQVLPAMYPGATPQAVLKTFDSNGNPVVKMVPIGTSGSTPAGPTGGAAFPVQRLTGAELAAKYGIKGLNDTTTYNFNTAGADAGKATPVEDTTDPLAEYGNVTGPALLSALNPADRAQVELLAKGRVAPPTAGSRSKPALRILALAGAAYPGVDFAKNYKTNIDFSASGKAGQNIIKSGTAIDHAARLYDSVDALGNVDAGVLSGTINGIKNAATSSNNPAIKTFLQNRDQFINELGAAIKGTGNATSLAEFKNFQKDLSDADSPTVIKSVIQRGISLLGDRLQNQVQPYNDTLGVDRSFLTFVPKAVAKQFMRLNPDYQLTDDDKTYLGDQSQARAQRSTPTVKSVPSPSSAKGGNPLPANTVAQYKAIPETNKAAARAYLKKQGYDITGLQ